MRRSSGSTTGRSSGAAAALSSGSSDWWSAGSTKELSSVSTRGSAFPCSGVEVIRDLAQDRSDLLRVCAARVPPAAEVAADVVEELHEVFEDDRHVVGGLASTLGETDGSLEDADGEGLKAALAVGDAELEPGALFGCRSSGGQGRGVQEDVLAVITRDEAEALLLVVEPDLA